MVLELVEGDDLQDLLKRNGTPFRERAVEIVLQVTKAVDFAQRQGVVHRDIKPSNILVSRTGTAKLFDFGLAHLGDQAVEMGVAGQDAEEIPTREGYAVGTVQYMSPEQGNDSDLVDTRSDIYSIGCTLYELLAGTPPFDSDSQHEILKKHARDPVPPIEGLDPELADILDKMLAKTTADRFQTPGEVIAALQNWQAANDESAAGNRAEIESQQEELVSQQNRLHDTESKLAKKMDELQVRLDRATETGEVLQQERESLKAERDGLDQEIRAFSQERADFDEMSAEIERLRRELAQDRQLLERQQAKSTTRDEELQTALEKHRSADNELQRERQDLELLQVGLEQERRSFSEAEQRLLQMQNNLAAEETRREGATAELAQQQIDLQQQQAEFSSRQETLADEQSALASVRDQLKNDERGLQTARRQFESDEKQLEQQRAEIDRAENEVLLGLAKLNEEREQIIAERKCLAIDRTELDLNARKLRDTLAEWLASRESMDGDVIS